MIETESEDTGSMDRELPEEIRTEHSIKTRKRQDAGAVAVIAALYAGMEWLGVTCPIRFLTGISCAGCGMSRAWLALFRLDIAAAFRCHPLFPLVVPGALLILFRSRIGKRTFWSGVVLLCGAFLIVYVVRLLDPGDSIVIWEPSQGLIGRMLSALRAGPG